MNNSLKYLIGTFFLLLLLFFINQSQQKRYNISSERIFNLDDSLVKKIILAESNNDSLILSKNDTIWSILYHDTLKIKDRQITQLFDKVINGKYDMLRSKNPKNWGKYGVSDSLSKSVSLFDENSKLLKKIYFGNKGSDYAHNNFRRNNENEVYRTTENIYYLINTSPTYWGEKPKPMEIIPDTTQSDIKSVIK